MRICSNAEELRNALNIIQPSRVAVAFVGSGWNIYVSPDNLKEIVLSSTLGSNPKAIEEIMKKIGPENVYFLDNLHSKLYLGEDSALLGSPNLSDNGFADSRLLEAGVVLNSSTSLRNLNAVFENYKTIATRQYPTPKSKKERLRKLMKQWQRSIWYGLNTKCDDENVPSIAEFTESELERIHIVGYLSDDCDYNYNIEAITAVVPEAIGLDPEVYFLDWLNFYEEDPIEPGDWLLCWRYRQDGYPYGRSKAYWLQVHHVIPNGVSGVNIDPYTKLGAQARNLLCTAPPFALDARTQTLIRCALKLPQFFALRSVDNNVWRLAPADAVVPRFLQYIREQYLRENA
ncbi:MAG: phospholipase D family protein [Methylococcaceae bacterium]|nr:phospholipase D family protein [Methylococcaceae bacterium]